MGIPNISPIERVQEAALTVAQAYLETELATMTTQAGGDLVLPVPAAYVGEPTIEDTNAPIVEIIPVTANPNTVGAPLEYGFGRVTTAVEWEARALLINDGRWDAPTFRKALNRYGGALISIFLLRYPLLGYSDGHVLRTLPNGKWRVTVDEQRDPGGKRIRRLHVPLVTTVQEQL